MSFASETIKNSLLEMLHSDIKFSRGNTNGQKLVVKYGRQFLPISRPKGIRQKTKKACFANSLYVAEAGRGFYVEGYAMKADLRPHDPFHHAWSTRDGIHAFDTTLVDNSDCLYFGIVIPSALLWEHCHDGYIKPILDHSTAFEELETMLQRALSSPPDYGTFNATAR